MRIFLSMILLLSIGLALVSVWRIPGRRPPLFRLLGVLTSLALVVELVGLITAEKGINNSLVFNLYIFVEGLLVPAMVYVQRPQWKPWLMIVSVLALAVLFWSAYMLGLTELVLTTAAMTNALLFVVLLLALLWHKANTGSAALHRSPPFWVFMGMLVYFGGLLPVVGSVPVIHAHDKRLAAVMWHILPVLASVRYLLAAYGCMLQAQGTHREHER